MDPPPSLPPVRGAKLRLMCSYGGHIIPRPHDKSLCYVGGDTRMVAIDRHSSLSSVINHLSRRLLDGRPFTLKYPLPGEDLDSLVSVTRDEDLDHLIEECDSISDATRIRAFLFFNKPESAASMGSLLDDAKSESWFVDALNGSLLSRNLSDSAAIESLVDGFHQDFESYRAAEVGEMNKQEVLNSGLPDSPVIDNGSPPIRVRVDPDQRVGAAEEQFAKMSFVQDNGSAALPPLPTAVAPPLNHSSDVSNGVLEYERSDLGVPVNYRKKPPLPLQTAQLKVVAGSPSYNLPSPDSAKTEIATQNPQIQIQQPQTQNPQYAQSDQQQKFIHRNTHHIPHPTAAATPLTMSSYYPIYTTQTPNNQAVDQNQQYPVYGMPIATASGGVYRTNPSLVRIQGSHFQPQYVRYAPMQVQAAATGLGAQYQTMKATTTVAQIATSQPIKKKPH